MTFPTFLVWKLFIQVLIEVLHRKPLLFMQSKKNSIYERYSAVLSDLNLYKSKPDVDEIPRKNEKYQKFSEKAFFLLKSLYNELLLYLFSRSHRKTSCKSLIIYNLEI